MPKARTARVARKTKETDIGVAVTVDGTGTAKVDTGVPFLDHMLDAFARHGFFDLTVNGRGDLAVDQHHTVEDVGLALGQALKDALGTKAGIRRSVRPPVIDRALVRVAVTSAAARSSSQRRHQARPRRPVRHRARARLPPRW
jgi:imidazoleglycerol-phosphate dehydratase